MTPVEILMDEHRNIERMLNCLEAMTVVFTAERRIDVESARAAIDFIRGYADRCHHGKEEAQLFPALVENGLSPDGGPTAVMRHEHEQGRAYVKEMEEALSAAEEEGGDASTRFARAARLYLGLLREHIQKEDHCLFPMVPQILDAQTVGRLKTSFDRFDSEADDQRKRFLQDLRRLEKRFPPRKPD